MSLKGQVVVVTGASSGIGEGVARELRAAGMRLVLTARRTEKLEALARELGECACVAGDVADPALPSRLIETALGRFKRCDVVFNGAGVMISTTIEEADIEALCAMVRVNFEALVRMSYTALKHFKKAGRGHLINVSSIVGTKVRDTIGVYAGTKYAVEALSQALRIELAKTDICISVIEPGLVETHLQDRFKVHPKAMLGIKAMIQPADIARCVRFVLEQPAHVRIPVMMVIPGEQAM
jgi:NADP-dependent 3-hydroxy acid dehydrogenase YdfG